MENTVSGESVFTFGTGRTVDISLMELQASDTYAIVNNADLTMTNITVRTGDHATIYNTSTVNVYGTLALDNSAVNSDTGTPFTYHTSSILTYVGGSTINITDDSAEFSTSIKNLSVLETGTILNIADLTTNRTIDGTLDVASEATLNLDDTLTVNDSVGIDGNLTP